MEDLSSVVEWLAQHGHVLDQLHGLSRAEPTYELDLILQVDVVDGQIDVHANAVHNLNAHLLQAVKEFCSCDLPLEGMQVKLEDGVL